MVRQLVRFAGFLLLAGAFAALIVDGTRSIAASEIMQTMLGQTLHWMLSSKFELIEPAVKRLHPLLWDPVLVRFFQVPTWVVLGVCGLLLLLIARPPAPRVGYSGRP